MNHNDYSTIIHFLLRYERLYGCTYLSMSTIISNILTHIRTRTCELNSLIITNGKLILQSEVKLDSTVRTTSTFQNLEFQRRKIAYLL